MVGIFPRFSRRTGLRRTQSAFDGRQVLPPISKGSEGSHPSTIAAAPAPSHGIEVFAEFKPVEYPIEPLDNDRSVKCPLPEPSIMNDAKIWKERMPANLQRRANLPVMTEGANLKSEAEAGGTSQSPAPSNFMISPSLSALQNNIIKLLEACSTSGV